MGYPKCIGGLRGEGGLYHRLTISRKDLKYYLKHRKFVALARVLWSVQVLRHYGESCQECGRRYFWTVWHSPDWLWAKLVGGRGGLLCPRCFGEKARANGYRLYWRPDVELLIPGEVVRVFGPEDDE